jgi:hypothetical protein
LTRERLRTSYERHHTEHLNTPRLRMKPKASSSGHVDGAWWPRGDDLAAELPALLDAMAFRLRAIVRVTYDPSGWIPAPAKLAARTRTIRLDADPHHPPDTIEIIDANRNSVVLLVVPSHTEPDTAHAIVMAAAAPSNTASVDELLAISELDRKSRTKTAAAQERWHSGD